MITVYWTAVIDGDVTELSAEVDHPVAAAQIMSAIESAENLAPAGWSWGTTEDYDRVMTMRHERAYGEFHSFQRFTVPEVAWRKCEIPTGCDQYGYFNVTHPRCLRHTPRH